MQVRWPRWLNSSALQTYHKPYSCQSESIGYKPCCTGWKQIPQMEEKMKLNSVQALVAGFQGCLVQRYPNQWGIKTVPFLESVFILFTLPHIDFILLCTSDILTPLHIARKTKMFLFYFFFFYQLQQIWNKIHIKFFLSFLILFWRESIKDIYQIRPERGMLEDF